MQLIPAIDIMGGSVVRLTKGDPASRKGYDMSPRTAARARGKVMKKGVTSGNVQRIVGILTDCDNDSLVYLVDQTGPACHLGERTCFHKRVAP